MKNQRLVWALVAWALLGVAVIVSAVLVDVQEQRVVSPPPVPNVVQVDGADADEKADDLLRLDPEAKEVVREAREKPEQFDLGGGLRGQDPTRAGVLTGPLAAQEWPGCKTAFVRSFSQRVSSIRAIGLHYTAGAERPGWSDLDGLTAYSNNGANQVSWHFAIDREGHCTYNVPTRYKAWTIGNLNSQTVNIEVVGTGREPDYAGPGFRTLSRVVRRIARVHNLPVQFGATDGRCNVTRRGIITHWMGGSCSGGHHDIRPYDIEAIALKIREGACGARCQRRREHERLHVRSRELRCARPAARARHPRACEKLAGRNRQLHRVGL